MAARRSTTSGRGGKQRTRGKLAPRAKNRGLGAAEVALALDEGEVAAVAAQVRATGGTPIGAYRDPLGAHALLLAALPLSAVLPTPFQRDLSPTHTQRLAAKIEEAQTFLDPLIVVQGTDGRWWTPNGRHRLAAAKMLGLKQITALISPNPALAYRILALNTEKAHNLKDRSLEVIRMARALASAQPRASEREFAPQFEAAELLTLGLMYEKNARFGGGAYHPFLKKVDRFSARTLAVSLRERAGYAARLTEIETQVKRLVAQLQKRGFKSPYLRQYVIARINPVRFHKQKKRESGPAMPIAQALTRMLGAARSFKLESVSNSDLAWVALGAES